MTSGLIGYKKPTIQTVQASHTILNAFSDKSLNARHNLARFSSF